MTKVTLIGGTGSLKEDSWWRLSSPFSIFLSSFDIRPVDTDEFIWSTDLNGVNLWKLITGAKKARHNDWEAGGAALKYYLKNVKLEDRNIISHSHARQVVLYALYKGLKINKWIDVSGPVREDMTGLTVVSESNVRASVHVYSTFDWVQILGSLLDGKLGLRVSCPISKNVKLPHEYGHSGILYKPELFMKFAELQLISFLTQEDSIPCNEYQE